MTADQLSYVLERKFINSTPGRDFVISESVEQDPNTGKMISNGDAKIRDWFMTEVEQPSESRLERMWEKLKEEYHGRPDRIDSQMAEFLEERNRPQITVNEEL